MRAIKRLVLMGYGHVAFAVRRRGVEFNGTTYSKYYGPGAEIQL